MLKVKKVYILKGNKPIVIRALLFQCKLILKVLGQTCSVFFVIVLKFFLQPVKDRESTEFLTNASEKHIEQTFQAFFNKNGPGRVITNSITIF